MTQKLLATFVSLVPVTCFAQFTATQAVTFAITETFSAPALPAKNENGAIVANSPLVFENEFSITRSSVTTSTHEYGSKMFTARISNREILLALVDEKVIDNITGYSLAFVSSVSANGIDDGKLMCVHRTRPSVDVSAYISFDSELEGEATTNITTKITTENSTTATSSNRISGSLSRRERIEISFFKIDDSEHRVLLGLNNSTERTHTALVSGTSRTVFVPGTSSITNISGSSGDNSSERSGYGLMEGRITAANSVVTLTPASP